MLRSCEPYEQPKIQLDVLADRSDVETPMACGRIARAALRSRACAPDGTGESKPGADVQTDDEGVGSMRENASGSYHPCGTCKMGIDPLAVVSPDLKVIGVEGLRVVESSIIPHIPSRDVDAISMAIGEKGVDMILRDRAARAATL